MVLAASKVPAQGEGSLSSANRGVSQSTWDFRKGCLLLAFSGLLPGALADFAFLSGAGLSLHRRGRSGRRGRAPGGFGLSAA